MQHQEWSDFYPCEQRNKSMSMRIKLFDLTNTTMCYAIANVFAKIDISTLFINFMEQAVYLIPFIPNHRFPEGVLDINMLGAVQNRIPLQKHIKLKSCEIMVGRYLLRSCLFIVIWYTHCVINIVSSMRISGIALYYW